jgi:hypothetical protein
MNTDTDRNLNTEFTENTEGKAKRKEAILLEPLINTDGH